MSSDSTVSLVGFIALTVLLVSYMVQKYLPPPVPKIVGFDLGTTYSSAAVYHAGTGEVEIVQDHLGRKSFPSVVAFLENGTVIVGHDAVAQSEHNSDRTFYDAKRFIGKDFTKNEFDTEVARYPFNMILNDTRALFVLPWNRTVRPEEIGAEILRYLKKLTEKQLSLKPNSITQSVLSAPAEFDEIQRNATKSAANQVDMQVLRIINEPTAAALAYGLHKKEGVDYVIIVDMGGGTLDVSLLFIQGSMFITISMAGNNHLGGQDFNVCILTFLLEKIRNSCGTDSNLCILKDHDDIQNLRLMVETAKIELTTNETTFFDISLHSLKDPKTGQSPYQFKYEMSRTEFEILCDNLFRQVLDPIQAAIADAQLEKAQVDEVVLVGGSTRMPAVRYTIGQYFGKLPNFGVDPELAVVTGVAIQAGVMGGGWPLQVGAIELPAKLKKIHVYKEKDDART